MLGFLWKIIIEAAIRLFLIIYHIGCVFIEVERGTVHSNIYERIYKVCLTLSEIEYIRTDTVQTNYITQRFYESLGFKKWDGARYFGNPHNSLYYEEINT